MKPPAKSYRAFPYAVFSVLLVLGYPGQAFADTNPTFVYVANIVTSNPHATRIFDVTATGICVNLQCASHVSINGGFEVDITTNKAIGGTMYLVDSSDLKSSPLTLQFDHQGNFAPSPYAYLYFRASGGTQPVSYVELVFPFLAFPQDYSGGPLCTTSSSPLCGEISGAEIGHDDMSAALFAATNNGTVPVSAQMTSGSVTWQNPPDQYSYSGTVSGYSVNSATGALSPIPGLPLAAGLLPGFVAVTPSDKFVYVANYLSNNVSAYTVDSTTGALTEVTGSPFPAAGAPRALAVDPSSKFLYVAGDVSHYNISAFTIDATTGALTPVPGSPYDAAPTMYTPGWNVSFVAMDPLGKFLYVPTQENLLTYKIDPNTGALTLVSSSSYGPGPQPSTAAVDPSGKFIYVTGKLNIQAYTVDGTTGALTKVSGSPFAAGIAYDPIVAIDPLGKFIYVMDNTDGSILAYTVNSTTGALTPIAGLPVAPAGLSSMAIDPSGKLAYVADGVSHGGIAAYAIDGMNGTLAPISGSPFAVGTEPTALAITHASPTEPFDTFQAKVEIDVDRKTSFRVGGFFKLSKTSNDIDPVSECVELQVGPFTATIPAGAFRKEGKHTFKYEGRINNVDLRMTIDQADRDDHKDRKDHDKGKDKDDGKDYLFTAEGKGDFPAKFVNPVTVGLTIGDYEGSVTVKADIDR